MGVLCCSNRKTQKDENCYKEKNLNRGNHNVDANSNYKENEIDNFEETELKELILNAKDVESIEFLIKLINNRRKIIIEGPFIISNWLVKPETLGELALLHILALLQNENLQVDNNFYKILKENHFISEILHMVNSNDNFKKDSGILILTELTTHDSMIPLMIHKEVFQKLFLYINNLRNLNYKNFIEHSIACLQIFRRIYVKSYSMRIYFLDIGGFQLLYECITLCDINILQEIIYAIEDLIYVIITIKLKNDNLLDNQPLSKMLIRETHEALIKLNIEKILIDLYQVYS